MNLISRNTSLTSRTVHNKDYMFYWKTVPLSYYVVVLQMMFVCKWCLPMCFDGIWLYWGRVRNVYYMLYVLWLGMYVTCYLSYVICAAPLVVLYDFICVIGGVYLSIYLWFSSVQAGRHWKWRGYCTTTPDSPVLYMVQKQPQSHPQFDYLYLDFIYQRYEMLK